MRRIQALVRTTIFSAKMLKHAQGGPLNKLKSTIRFIPLYLQHYQSKLDYIHKNLQLKKQRESLQSHKNTQYYKDIIGKYFKLQKQLQDKGNDFKQNLKNEQIRESIFQSIVKFVFEKMSLFYQSLQALVEGRREVLNNEEYVFEDGKSVKEKREKFEKYVSRLFGTQKNGEVRAGGGEHNTGL